MDSDSAAYLSYPIFIEPMGIKVIQHTAWIGIAAMQ